MSQALDYPQVTHDLLQEVVRRILSVGAPHKIILLGSRARGDARSDSDLDLLVIEDSDRPSAFPQKQLCIESPDGTLALYNSAM
jgi:predicted nucleotidyltransferase